MRPQKWLIGRRFTDSSIHSTVVAIFVTKSCGSLTSTLERAGKLDDLEYRGLQTRRVFVLDVEGETRPRWSLWSCITGEIDLEGITYVIDAGDFFEVDADYLGSLDRWVDDLDRSTAILPDWDSRDREDIYNQNAAESRGHLLLDRKTVQLPGSTAVEVCDLLSSDGKLIHVKRNSGSSDLSHLFSQGVVSATALQDDPDFRALARRRDPRSWKVGRNTDGL